MEQHASPSSSASQHGAKTLFWYFSLFWTLGIVAFAIGAIWFQLINKFFPVEIGYQVIRNAFNQELVKGAIAALIVGAPVFYLFATLIRKAIGRNEIDLKRGSRQWVSYLILFIVVVITVVDIITTVVFFLNGDFTTRFILKALTILIITSWVFYYFWSALKSNDGLKSSKLPQINLIVSLVVIIVTLGVGFTLIDSPATSRAKAYDRTRENDLRNIYYSVNNYFSENKVLPENLEALRPVNQYKDPQTGTAYEYRVIDGDTYELCATFQTANDEAQSEAYYYEQIYREDAFLHQTGRTCFELDAEDYQAVKPIR